MMMMMTILHDETEPLSELCV